MPLQNGNPDYAAAPIVTQQVVCNSSEPDDYLAGDHRDAIRRIATDADGHGQLGTDGRFQSPPRPRSARLRQQRPRCSPREPAFFTPRRRATPSMPRLRWCSRAWSCIWLRRRLPSRPLEARQLEQRDPVGHGQLRADGRLFLGHNLSLHGVGNDGNDAYHGHLRDSRHAGGQQHLLGGPAGLAELHREGQLTTSPQPGSAMWSRFPSCS